MNSADELVSCIPYRSESLGSEQVGDAEMVARLKGKAPAVKVAAFQSSI
ncbi:hypothetical protein [Acrocarpospora sp. B8E8]